MNNIFRQYKNIISILIFILACIVCASFLIFNKSIINGDIDNKNAGNISKKYDKNNTIFLNLFGKITGNFDPNYISWLDQQYLMLNIFEALLTFDNAGNIIPGLAERWKINDQENSITFYLRDAYWSDGKKITTKDFQLSFQRMVSRTKPVNHSFLVEDMIKNAREVKHGTKNINELGVKIINDKTIKFYLIQRPQDALRVFAIINLVAIPSHINLEKSWVLKTKISSGPYRIAKYIPGDKIILKHNPHYYGYDKNKPLNDIVYTNITDIQAAYLRFITGNLSAAFIPNANLADAKKRFNKYVIKKQPNDGILYAVINAKKFKNANIRKAISLAIDRKKLSKIGIAYTPIKSFMIDNAMQSNDFNVEKKLSQAQNIMKKSGYSEAKKYKIRLSYHASHKVVAIALSNMLSKAYFAVALDMKSEGIFYSDLETGNYDIGLPYWTGMLTGNRNMYYGPMVTNHKYNYSRHNNKNFDKVYYSQHQNKIPLKNIYHKLDTILAKDNYIIPILQTVSYIAIQPYLKGYIPNVDNIHLGRYMSIHKSGK